MGGGTAILVRRGIDHHAIPVPGLTHLKATAIQIALAGRPVKVLVVYVSPSRPLLKRDLSVCLSVRRAHRPTGGRLERQARGLKLEVEHDKGETLAWLRRQKVVLDTWSGQSHNHPLQPVCHTRCLRHRLHQEPHDSCESDCLLGTQLRQPPSVDQHYVPSAFLTLQDRPDFELSDWTRFQDYLDDNIPFNPELRDKEAVDACVTTLSSAILSVLIVATHKSRLRFHSRPLLPAAIQDKIRLKNRLRR
jgi:hypothetical protein